MALARLVVATCLLLSVFGGRAAGATAQLRYVDPVSDLVSGCLLQAFQLTAGLPDGVSIEQTTQGERQFQAEDVRSGKLRLGGGEYPVAVALSTEGIVLLADTNQDGAMMRIAWQGMTADGRLVATVPLRIYNEQGADREYPLLLLWDPFVPFVLAYCRGGYTSGTIDLGGVEYLLAVVDDDSDGRYDDLESGTLFIDSDRDGVLLATMDSHEQFALDELFNLDGTTYAVSEVASNGMAIVIVESARSVAAKVPLIVGSDAPSFAAETTEGVVVSLEDLHGSVVLLDFWAGWCSPCVQELPGVQALHETWSEQGLVVLGISLDRSETAMGRAVEEHGLTYVQLYDGDDAISDLYRIAGIPMTYVVGRDGTIVARGLRGLELREAVEAELDRDPVGSEGPVDGEGE